MFIKNSAPGKGRGMGLYVVHTSREIVAVCFYSSPDGCFRYPQRAMRRASERPSRSPPLGRIDSPSGKCQGLGGDLRFLLFNVFLAGLDPEESLPVLGRTI